MEYSLLFTIYGAVFNIILFITVMIKKTKKTPRTKTYIFLIVSSLCFAISEIISIYYFTKTGDFNGYSLIWKIRNTFIIWYVYSFIVYFNLLIKGEKYDTLFQTLFKTPLFLILFIIFTIVVVLYLIFVGVDSMTPDNLIYVRGIIAIVLVCLSILTLCGYTALKLRKENIKISRCLLLIIILFILIMPVQLRFDFISFMPFLTMFIMFVIYHNIENPDIELLEEVTELKKHIDKSSNAKTDFLFNLSYDLINPINAIISLSQSLITLPTDNKEEIIRDLKSIKYAGNTLLDSINNVLDFSETDELDNKIYAKNYNLYELLKRIETVALTRIGAKQIQFEMNIDDNLYSVYQGDITKIQKILLNVINNSVKYTDIGKIKLTVTSSQEKDNEIIHFKISDTGCGIKEEEKEFIFTDSKETSGIGLALTEKYVEIMNGSISFDSVYGAGTTFNINIPQKPTGTKKIIEDKNDDTKNNIIEFIDCSKYKALIVDDDQLDIKITKRLVEKYKFQITVMTSTLECIDKIKQEEQYDIIFMDIQLPGMDGYSAARNIRRLPREEAMTVPILAMTANAFSQDVEKAFDSGMNAHIAKPIDVDELFQKLYHFLYS